jgi:nucleolar GTP-binding protein
MKVFQRIKPIEDWQSYLDVAFNRAKARADREKRRLKPKTFDQFRHIEKTRFGVVRDVLQARFNSVVASFPQVEELPLFYNELIRITVDYGKLKRSLASLKWVQQAVGKLHREYQYKLRKTKDRDGLQKIMKSYYGRISSLGKQISKDLMYLEDSRKVMKTYPDVKELPTVAIAGFPNVGKTTLLSKLSSSKPEIAEYAFTTKHINMGYMQVGSRELQLLDTPGTLGRVKSNPIEIQAQLALKHLADAIVYVFDPLESYPLANQEKLYKLVLDEKKPMVAYVSKTDITTENVSYITRKFSAISLQALKKQLALWAKKFS